MREPEDVTTQHGMTVTVRPVSEADAAGLYEMDLALIRDGRGMVQTLDDVPDLARYQDRMFGRIRDVDLWLVAERKGKVVAAGSVRRLRPALCAHVGMFEIAVSIGSQGRGIGRVLAEALLRGAHDIGVERLELYVRSDNHRAIALYSSLGFEVEATRVGFLKLPDGTWLDDLSMVRWLSPGP